MAKIMNYHSRNLYYHDLRFYIALLVVADLACFLECDVVAAVAVLAGDGAGGGGGGGHGRDCGGQAVHGGGETGGGIITGLRDVWDCN